VTTDPADSVRLARAGVFLKRKRRKLMLFVVTAMDKPGKLQTRLDNRLAHLEYLTTVKNNLKLAGPFLGQDNQTAVGSLFIYECPDEAAVRAIVDNDPFAKAALFTSIEIKAWRQGAGTPLG
jgi:uncharacterized protein YciI